ncbi:MAG: aldo/keto reductase, partial [Acidimicrobiia bacterium]
GCTPGQLALAWTASNPNVSSVILGARHVGQLKENLDALEVLEALTDEQKDNINEIFT